MIVLGLVLLLLVGGLVADAVVENGQTTTVTLLHQHLSVHQWGVFVAGVAAGGAAITGFWLVSKGMARDSRRRREHRQLLREHRAARQRGSEPAGAAPETAQAGAAWAGPTAVLSRRRSATYPEPAVAAEDLAPTAAASRDDTRPAVAMAKARAPREAKADDAARSQPPGSEASPSESATRSGSPDTGEKPGVFARLRR